MPKAIFQTSELTKICGTGEVEVRALDGATMELYEGEIAVLLGLSDSGKSTFVNIIGGLDQATSGAVTYLDMNLTSMSERELIRYRRDHVGFVFQFYNLIPL